MFLIRKFLRLMKYLGRRRMYSMLFLAWSTLLLAAYSVSIDQAVMKALMPPELHVDLDHFRRSTNVQHYLDNIHVVVEPSSACPGEVPLIILVASAASHGPQRQVIRAGWARHQPTYFVLGLEGDQLDERMVDNYVEAKLYSDMIIFDMPDHYQNLTLKTVLMLQWSQARCPHAQFLFKTDDDVVVNPWILKTVIDEHEAAKLIGYRVNNSKLHRDEHSKWFVPRWLHRLDEVPQYLSGTGYIINGKYIKDILEAALKTPLINLEDVYLTYLVAHSTLNYELTHDRRLSPYRPWFSSDCTYWTLASLHSLKPDEAAHAWTRISHISDLYAKDKSVCNFYRSYIESDMLLY